MWRWWIPLVFIGSRIVPMAEAHGYLAHPKSRNLLANSNNCPHCLNGGGAQATKGTTYPHFRVGMCGDRVSSPRDHEAGGKFARGKVTGVYRRGGRMHISFGVATYHRGAIQYRICRYRAGTPAQERAALTDSCLNRHILRAPSGSQWMYLGTGPESGQWPPKLYRQTFRLPSGLSCDGKRWKCVLQSFWITGNTCRDTRFAPQESLGYLQKCSKNVWPEIFVNCADIRILE